MSKITFRADDDLVDRLEACDASKSEVMREALRTHLDGVGPRTESPDPAGASDASNGRVDDALADRVDELIAERLDAALAERAVAGGSPTAQENGGDVTVNVTVDAPDADAAESGDDVRVTRRTDGEPAATPRKTLTDAGAEAPESACGGCGEPMPSDHVYCPNCGEKQSHRMFCECGDELRTDWAFCPGCGRRTPAADVLKDP